ALVAAKLATEQQRRDQPQYHPEPERDPDAQGHGRRAELLSRRRREEDAEHRRRNEHARAREIREQLRELAPGPVALRHPANGVPGGFARHGPGGARDEQPLGEPELAAFEQRDERDPRDTRRDERRERDPRERARQTQPAR